MTAGAGPQAGQLRQLFSGDDGRATIRRNLATRKTLARLVEIATQDTSAASTEEEEEKPRQKRKKAGEATHQPAVEVQSSEGQTT